MNSIIETLNLWGEQAARFAWPMFWQSSLLIGVVLAIEFACRRRLRASVRYALWLVVLAKLVLPPSLALPTGLGWWVRPPAATPLKPRLVQARVNYAPALVQQLPVRPVPVLASEPPTAWTPWGGALAGSSVVSLGLLAWVLARWRQAARVVRQAAPPSTELERLLDETRRAVGLRRPVRLRLTEEPMSPAVCGWFRPVVLLPRGLAEQLPPARLRIILLHELVHLRRGDTALNGLLMLLQIGYWWHPLLWLANARVRRVREEAVDDAVMLLLREEAEQYPPTLLEVARLALYRPLASLGLIGILESRHSLRRRIERLVDFRPPRQAGLTLASVLCMLAFGALALPMGQAPAPTDPTARPTVKAGTNSVATNLASKRQAEAMFVRGQYYIKMNRLTDAETQFKEALVMDPGNKAAWYYLNFVREARDKDGTQNVPPKHEAAQTPKQLCYRTIKVDPRVFLDNLAEVANVSLTDGKAAVLSALRHLIAESGVELNSPKCLFWNDREGIFLVHATPQDVDIIASTIGILNTPPSQLVLEVKFVELPELASVRFGSWLDSLKVTKLDSITGNEACLESSKMTKYTNYNSRACAVVLTPEQAGAALKMLQDPELEVDMLSDERAVTLSGRQTQLQVVEYMTITNFISAHTSPPVGTNEALPKANVMPFGPTIDLLPVIMPNEEDIELTAIPSLVEFLGYACPTNPPRAKARPLPDFRIRQMTAQVRLKDGQTLVLGRPVDENKQPAEKPGDGKKRLLVFVTPTIIDSAGNALHPLPRSGH